MSFLSWQKLDGSEDQDRTDLDFNPCALRASVSFSADVTELEDGLDAALIL